MLALFNFPVIAANITDNGEAVQSGNLGGEFADGIYWEFADGTLIISGEGWMNSQKSEYPWDGMRDQIKKVIIEDGLEDVGDQAFMECVNLLKVTIPDSVGYIGDQAFEGCVSLGDVMLSEEVQYIGYSAFKGCVNLVSILIPDSVYVFRIEGQAFEGCVKLEEVTIPRGTMGIDQNAFGDCIGLRTIKLGIDSIFIDESAFRNVTATVSYPAGVPCWSEDKRQGYGGILTWEPYNWSLPGGICGDNIEWSLENGVLSITGTGEMYDFRSLDEDISRTTTAPWNFVGYTTDGLIGSVIMSDDITYIGTYAFAYMTIGDVNINFKLPKNLQKIGDLAFCNISGSRYPVISIVIPEGTTEIGEAAFYGSRIKRLTIPDTVKHIGAGAIWKNAVYIKELYIPNVRYWLEVVVPAAGTAYPIPEDTKLFIDGAVVEDLEIPVGTTHIPENAFAGYAWLRSVQIPDSVKSVGADAFNPGSLTFHDFSEAKPRLEEIVFPASVESIGERALDNNDVLKKIVILNKNCILPAGYTENGEYHTGLYYSERDNKPVIYGFAGSTAEAFAAAEGFAFCALQEYEVLDNSNPVVSAGDPATVRVNGDISKFEKVTVDGLVVDSSNYTVTQGSTVIAFKPEYLATLEPRSHNVTVFFSDGVAEATVTVHGRTPGDTNCDGAVNGKDGILLAQYLAEWDVSIDMDAADVNGDGKVNGKDGILLAQYLAEWDVTLQ